MIRSLGVEERRFSAGTSRVVTFRADDVVPRSLTMPARLRALEMAEQLAAQLGKRVSALALPPARLRTCGIAESLRCTTEGEELLSLRSLLAYHVGKTRQAGEHLQSAPPELVELVRYAVRRGLLALATRGPGEPEAFVPVGGVGLARLVGPFLRPAIVTNAHFFVILPSEQDSYHVPVGEAVGLTARAGVIGRPPTAARSALLRTRSGWRVEKVSPEQLVVVLPGGREIRRRSDAGEIHVRGPGLPGGRTPVAPEVVELTIIGRWVVAAAQGGGRTVPHGGLVVSLNIRPGAAEMAALRRGEPVSYRLEGVEGLATALQAGPRLLAGGRVVVDDSSFASEEFSATGAREPTIPTVFPTDAGRSAAARLGVGVCEGGELVVAAVEGASSLRAGKRAGSAGCTLLELAELLLELGAREAVNLDGGGSVQVVAGSGALLRPADERGVAGASFDRPVPAAASFT